MKNEILLIETKEKGELLIKAIELINNLAKSGFADTDSEDDSEELNELKSLIVKSRTLTNSRWWDSL